MSSGRYFLTFLFLLLATSFSFASMVWKYDASSPIVTGPFLYEGNLVVGTESGILYAITTQGKLAWKKDVGKYPLEPAIYQDELVAASSEGKFTFTRKDGTTRTVIDIRKASPSSGFNLVYGISSSGKLYFTSDRGFFSLERNGSVTPVFLANGTLTPPYVDQQRAVFGANKELVHLRMPSGSVAWIGELGGAWKSRPAVDSASVYAGATDDSLSAYSLSNGVRLWKVQAEGWVAGSPLLDSGNVYFGSNDGYVYAADKSNGNVVWKAKSRKAVYSNPISGVFGGREAVFVGSTDGNLYALDKSNGAVLSQIPANDWVGTPLFTQSRIAFASRDSFLYYADNRRGCSIVSPEYGITVGPKEVKVRGNAVSESGKPTVSVSVNDGAFDRAESGTGMEWTYIIDPSKLESGINTISCRVSDGAGEETAPYTTTLIFHSKNISKGTFIITSPRAVEEGGEFTIFVNDAEDGSALENFRAVYQGKEEVATSNITFSATTTGQNIITISKPGFVDAVVAVDVYSSSGIMSIAIPAIAAIGVLGIIFFAYRNFTKKKPSN